MHRLLRAGARGYSLVELLTVAALVAILGSFSLPVYREHVRRANRAQARTALMEAAQYMQQFYATNDRYDARAGAGAGAGAGDDGVALPPQLQSTPPGARPAYTLALSAVTYNTFTVAATPAGSMAGDTCGALTLTQAGVQGATGAADASALHACWR